MALTRLSGANAITGTIPSTNIANASLNSVTALPAAVPVGSLIKINTQSVTSGTPSSIESGAVFSSTYDNYIIVIRRINLSANGGLQFRIGASGGYVTSGNRWAGSGADAAGTSLVVGVANSSIMDLLGGTSASYHVNTTQDCLSGTIWVNNPFNSNRTSIHAEMSWENATDVDVHINNMAAHPNTDASYDRWTIFPSTGTFQATTHIDTYGVKV